MAAKLYGTYRVPITASLLASSRLPFQLFRCDLYHELLYSKLYFKVLFNGIHATVSGMLFVKYAIIISIQYTHLYFVIKP